MPLTFGKMHLLMRYFLFLLVTFSLVPAVSAQTPTPDQIRQFNALPQAQKQALARQFGVTLPSAVTTPAKAPVAIDIFEERKVTPAPQPVQSDAVIEEVREEERVATTRDAPDEPKLRQFSDLRTFGYSLFASQPTTFAPVGAVPLPENYQLGPGDELVISMFGQQQDQVSILLGVDGVATVPNVGRVNLQGLNFEDARDLLKQSIEERLIGVDVAVTLGELRSIQIFVLGDVAQPGSFAVSPFSTVLNALFVAGGVTDNGSLRKIQLKRSGETIAQLDLYDLLLRGDISGDQRIQSGDVIFVPSVGDQVAIAGEVKRPGVFEVGDNETLADVIGFASGFSGFAFENEVRIRRTEQGVSRVSRSLASGELSQVSPQSGDEIEVLPVDRMIPNAVEVAGLVERPGLVQWSADLTLKQVVEQAGLSRLPGELLVVWEQLESSQSALNVRMLRAAQVLNGTESMALQARDRVTLVPVLASEGGTFSRQRFFDALARRIENSTPVGERPRLISIGGLARSPGPYPLVRGMDALQVLTLAELEGEPESLLVVIERASNAQAPLEVEIVRVTDLLDGLTQVSLDSGDRLSVVPIGAAAEGQFGQAVPFNRSGFFAGLARRIENATPANQRPPLVRIDGLVRSPGLYPLVKSLAPLETLMLAQAQGEPDSLLVVVERRDRPSEAPTIQISRLDEMMSNGRLVDFGPGDRVSFVPAGPSAEGQLGETVGFDRAAYFADLARRIRNATPVNELAPLAQVSGAVRLPGIYPLTQGGRIDDAILLAGGFLPDADRTQFELIQRTQRGFEVTHVGPGATETINAGSELIVRIDREQQNLTDVTIEGFVRFPGTYRMPEGARLSDLIMRAGGVLPEADLRAAVFSRARLRQQEAELVQRLREEAEQALLQQQIERRDLTTGASDTENVAELVGQLDVFRPSGRLVVDLPAVLAGQFEQDVLLEPGDRLSIPNIQQSVAVLGSVLYPTAHVFEMGLSAQDYIQRSGGFNARADEGRIFVVRVNGAVEPLQQAAWLAPLSKSAIYPGDTIVVPQDLDRVNGLNLWSSVTSIIYQAAVTLAVVNGL